MDSLNDYLNSIRREMNECTGECYNKQASFFNKYSIRKYDDGTVDMPFNESIYQ